MFTARRQNFAKLSRLLERWLPLPCIRGGPAIEFALVAPILTVMLLAVFDLSEAVITTRKLTIAAQELVEVSSAWAANPTTTGILNTDQVSEALSVPLALFPQWQTAGAGTPYGITLSSVAILAIPPNCTAGCTYQAQTAWSYAVGAGQPVGRPCGVLGAVPNTQNVDLTTLPAGVFSPPAMLVADVSTIFTPSFFAFLTGPIALSRSAYMPPRQLGSASYVQLTPHGASNCAGFQ